MTNTTRPALLGYIAIKNRHTTPAAENRMRQRLIAFADSEGYTLQGIFTDTLDTGSAKSAPWLTGSATPTRSRTSPSSKTPR